MTNKTKAKGGPDKYDVFAGARLREKRLLAGVSQDALGDMIGVSFQQIQKYEKGQNRISASRIFQFAQIFCEGDTNEFFPKGGIDGCESAYRSLLPEEISLLLAVSDLQPKTVAFLAKVAATIRMLEDDQP